MNWVREASAFLTYLVLMEVALYPHYQVRFSLLPKHLSGPDVTAQSEWVSTKEQLLISDPSVQQLPGSGCPSGFQSMQHWARYWDYIVPIFPRNASHACVLPVH